MDSVQFTLTFENSVEELWDAWTKPEMVSKWFGSDPNGKVIDAKIDVRIGGSYSVTFQDSDGTEHTCSRIYSEVTVNKSLKFTWNGRVNRATLLKSKSAFGRWMAKPKWILFIQILERIPHTNINRGGAVHLRSWGRSWLNDHLCMHPWRIWIKGFCWPLNDKIIRINSDTWSIADFYEFSFLAGSHSLGIILNFYQKMIMTRNRAKLSYSKQGILFSGLGISFRWFDLSCWSLLSWLLFVISARKYRIHCLLDWLAQVISVRAGSIRGLLFPTNVRCCREKDFRCWQQQKVDHIFTNVITREFLWWGSPGSDCGL